MHLVVGHISRLPNVPSGWLRCHDGLVLWPHITVLTWRCDRDHRPRRRYEQIVWSTDDHKHQNQTFRRTSTITQCWAVTGWSNHSISIKFHILLFWKNFGGHKSFLWGHWYPCFGLLVTSLGSSLIRTWRRHTWYMFHEIHLSTSRRPAWQPIASPHACFSRGRMPDSLSLFEYHHLTYLN